MSVTCRCNAHIRSNTKHDFATYCTCMCITFIYTRTGLHMVYMDCQTFSNIVFTHQDITQTELSKCKTNRVNLFQIQRGGWTSIEWDIFAFPGFLVFSGPKSESERRTNIDPACFCTFSCFASEASNTIMLSPRKMGFYTSSWKSIGKSQQCSPLLTPVTNYMYMTCSILAAAVYATPSIQTFCRWT